MEFPDDHKRTFLPEAFYLGFILITTQIILVREFLIIFNGNELVIGFLFSTWMLLTAMGAWTGRIVRPKKRLAAIVRLLLITISLYPIAATFALEFFRNMVFEPGRMISPTEIMASAFVLLLPQCFSGGLAFNLVNSTASGHSRTLQAYFRYESLGSLVGGLLVSVIFIYSLEFDNLVSLQYLALAGMIFFGITDYRLKKFFQGFIYLLAAIGIMHLIYNYDLNAIAKNALFAGQELEVVRETTYGNLVLTRTGDQVNVYENGMLSHSSHAPVLREESVHLPLLQRMGVRDVLLIGGSFSGLIDEMLKYPALARVEVLEANPAIFEAGDFAQKHFAVVDITAVAMDPVRYLNETERKYDAVIISQPVPASVQTNRFYTLEFFSKLKNLVPDSGVVSTSLAASANYLSDEEVKLHSTLYRTMKEVFDHVLIVPGSKSYFLASDSALDLRYSGLLDRVTLDNTYVNHDHLRDDLLGLRWSAIDRVMQQDAPINTDFQPIVYLMNIRDWLGYYGISIRVVIGCCLLICLMFIAIAKPSVSSMFVSGYTGASAEIILIIAFQVMFGFAYLFIGLIITVFMAGLALGAYLSERCEMQNWWNIMSFIQLFSGIYLLIVALKLTFLKDLGSPFLMQLLFLIMTLIIAALVGLQYGASVCRSKASPGVTLSRIYSADLVGASLGSLLTVIWLVPLLGLINTLILLGSLHFLNLLTLGVKHKLNYF